MALGSDRDLVPLGTGFDVVKRGYDKAQVEDHLERLDADLKLLAADRDAAVSQANDLARQLEKARSEIDDLRGQVDRLSLPPTTLEGLSERLQRMLRLAQEEANETKARAEAEAGHIRARAEEEGAALRQRYEQMIRDLDARRAAMETEHKNVLETARGEAARITGEADKLRADRDEAAAQARAKADSDSLTKRTQVEEDFEIAMSARRTDAMRTLAEQEAASKNEAEKRVREATEEANRRRHDSIAEATARLREATDESHRRVREATDESTRRVNDATRRVEQMRVLRNRIAGQLTEARGLILAAAPLLERLPEEKVADESPTVQVKVPEGGAPAQGGQRPAKDVEQTKEIQRPTPGVGNRNPLGAPKQPSGKR
jgi:cell division septum initiation protein DivIVA